MIKRLTFGVLLWTLATTGQADIYRCEIDGVTVFADAPCQQDARPYQSSGNVSVVEAPSNLAEIEAANQALIQHRLDQQAERAAAARRRSETTIRQNARPETVPYIPVYGLPHHGYDYSHDDAYDNRYNNRYDDRRGSGPMRRPTTDDSQRPARYSALSGRFPGTRRRDQDDQ